MRAVTGSVASLKRISVSKSAAILSRFAAADTGAPRDVAAYLKRASAAFDELVRFNREVRDARRRPERGSRAEEKEARRKNRAGSDGDPKPTELEGIPRGRPEKEIRWIREVQEEKVMMEDGGDGNLTEVEGGYGGGIGRGEDGKRSKKGVNDEQKRCELGARNEKKMEVERERRKDEKKTRRLMGEEGRDGGGKKRRNSDVVEENEGEGLDDLSERHKKRKKRREIGMEE